MTADQGDTTGTNHASDTEAYLEHAKMFWEAEEKNATRLVSQVRLLITLAVAIIAGVGLRLSQSYTRQIEDTLAVIVVPWLLFTLLLVMAVVLTARKRLAILLLAFGDLLLWLWHGSSDYLHSALTGAMFGTLCWMFVFLMIAMYRLLIPVPAPPRAGSLEGAGGEEPPAIGEDGGGWRGWFRSVGAHAYRRLMTGVGVDDAPPDTASGGFELSNASLAYASRIMGPGQWSTFRRQYRSAMDLQARNLLLRDRVRTAQRSLGSACILGPIVLVLLIQADASATRSSPNGTEPAPVANNSPGGG